MLLAWLVNEVGLIRCVLEAPNSTEELVYGV